MTQTSRTKKRANYDRLSRWYDLLAEHSEKQFRVLALQKLNVQPGERILEIGFGTGQALLSLAQAAGNSGQVFGLDISQGMMDIARTRLAQAGLTNRVTLVFGDALELPLAANFLDGVYMSFTLELFDTGEISVVLGNCFDALAENGRLCIVAISESGQTGKMMKLYKWAHERWPQLIDCRPILVQQAVADAGFQITESILTSLWGIPIEIIQGHKKYDL